MKKINFFTYDYPFEGNDNKFIEDELSMISTIFDKVNVIPIKKKKKIKKNFIKKDNIFYDFSLSENIFKYKNIINIFFSCILCKYFWREIFNVSKKNIFLKLKMIISERILAENTYNWIIKYKNLNLQNEIFYSYWSNFTLMSFYFLKKKNLINFCFARTLGSDLNGFIPNDDFIAFKKFKFKMLNFLIILNEGQREKLKKEKLLNDEKIFKCYQGINLQIFEEKQKHDKKIHILSCGRLVHVKNTLQILNFIQKFSQSVRDYEIIYTCIGTGPDLINVKKTADLKLKHVKFNLIENVPNLVEFIKKNKIDFYINLSKSEGMSFAVMEAMSLGIPVICSDIPGNTEIINNKNGYVLKSSNDLEMKKIIEEIKNDLENRTVYNKKIETINFVKNKLDRKIVLQQMKNLLKNNLFIN